MRSTLSFSQRLLLLALLAALQAAPALARVSFNADIRPILAQNCFECHGPAKSKAGLRLDSPAATNILKSGLRAISPGRPDQSEALRRLRASDPDDLMPPPNTGKHALTPAQSALIEQWISEGGLFDRHWSLAPIRRPAVPAAPFPNLARNPIDAFVQQCLARANAQPAPAASARTLLRRLSFDARGLPFTQSIPNQLPLPQDQWQRQIDAALASPEFGERMALWWLDLVRYADTDGYHADGDRNVYPYRDYVIDAFNQNKPFDRFTIEQLAGDLLPDPAWEQKIASGYNRLNLTTRENGANPREYLAKYDVDRARNLGSVWLGLTLDCARCHDHKFDPITAADFYSTTAFFADIAETPVGQQKETVLPDKERPEEIAALERALERLRADLSMSNDALACEQHEFEESLRAGADLPSYFPRTSRIRELQQLVLDRADRPLTAAEEKKVKNDFIIHFRRNLRAQLAARAGEFDRKFSRLRRTLLTTAAEPRPIRVLARGDWQDESGPLAQPAFLSALPKPASPSRRLDRLDLARWLVSPEQPLTARVTVNRLWQLFFAEGLVRTPDDFGAQGEPPTHPELLDWLAAEFIDSGWNVKHIVRLILSSHTYQQSSRARPDLAEADPDNRLFARQNRFPLPAALVRDAALQIAGILHPERRLRPVRLPQSESFGLNVTQDAPDLYEPAEGGPLYARAVYVYRRRTLLHPSFAAFNASDRERCVSRPEPVEGPAGALALLNARTFVEASRAFAERSHRRAGADAGRIDAAFQIALSRSPTEAERALLLNLLAEERAVYSHNRLDAARLIWKGHYRWPQDFEAEELAAWTNVARAILSLAETTTRY